MIGFSILSNLFDNVLSTGFVKGIHHSIISKPAANGKGTKPAAPVQGRMIYVGPDDTKGFSCYCRQIGPLSVDKSELIGGCNGKLYTTSIPHSLVFFNDNEKRSHDDILARLLNAVIKTEFIKLSTVHSQPDVILKREVPTGKFNFTTSTFYIAIDFNVTLKLKADSCEVEIACDNVNNPYV